MTGSNGNGKDKLADASSDAKSTESELNKAAETGNLGRVIQIFNERASGLNVEFRMGRHGLMAGRIHPEGSPPEEPFAAGLLSDAERLARGVGGEEALTELENLRLKVLAERLKTLDEMYALLSEAQARARANPDVQGSDGNGGPESVATIISPESELASAAAERERKKKQEENAGEDMFNIQPEDMSPQETIRARAIQQVFGAIRTDITEGKDYDQETLERLDRALEFMGEEILSRKYFDPHYEQIIMILKESSKDDLHGVFSNPDMRGVFEKYGFMGKDSSGTGDWLQNLAQDNEIIYYRSSRTVDIWDRVMAEGDDANTNKGGEQSLTQTNDVLAATDKSQDEGHAQQKAINPTGSAATGGGQDAGSVKKPGDMTEQEIQDEIQNRFIASKAEAYRKDEEARRSARPGANDQRANDDSERTKQASERMGLENLTRTLLNSGKSDVEILAILRTQIMDNQLTGVTTLEVAQILNNVKKQRRG